MSARPSKSAAVPSQPDALRACRVLVVEDSTAMREMIARVLRQHAFDTAVACDGAEALDLIAGETFDVVVSDLRMPNVDGLALLGAAKAHDPDLPVVLLTGAPDLPSAIKAVELGAFRYLTKPFEVAELVEVIARAHRLRHLARIRHEAAALADEAGDARARRAMQGHLDEALGSLTMAYQPLVDVAGKTVLGYEALLRCSSSLREPLEVIHAAERLDRLADLGRCVRRAVLPTLAAAPMPPGRLAMFINLHPLELLDDDLIDPRSPLAAHAASVVLEITERAALDRVDRLAYRVAELKKIGYRLAIDDLGAGYASLNSFAQLQPDFVKLDMALVQNAPADPMRRRLIRSMVQVCDELGIAVIGEGVETAEQRDTLERLGCRMMQGFLFARPAASFPEVSW